MQMDFLWTLIGFTLTLLVFSYLFGDNFLFRLAASLFIGVTAGYSVVLIIDDVIVPRMFVPLSSGNLQEVALAVVPLILGILIFCKLSPRISKLGSVSMGFLVGIGAALLVGGVATGTLAGQIRAAVSGFDLQPSMLDGRSAAGVLGESVVFLVGTLSTLAYFQFTTGGKNAAAGQQSAFLKIAANIGKFFIAVTLGAIFAGVFAAALTALIDRLDFLTEFIFEILF